MAKKQAKPQPLTAAIYARYSSTAQNDASIEQQIAECEQYAQANGLTVIARFEDRAISGRSDKRPGFQKCLRAAERHEFQVLLAYKSNRISRNMQSALNYEQRLANAGVRVVYCKEEFGDNATGRFMLRMMMNMNQFYSENMSEDIRRGMVDSAQKGRVVGSVPFGYKKGADSRYEIDEPAAEIVREIFFRYLQDESLADIRRDLNARGLLTRQKRPWSKNSFRGILTNEKYTGVYTFGDVRVEDAIPAIIDKGVYAMAQGKLDGEKIVRKRHRGNEDYVLTGKLFCGHCFAPMVGMSGRSHVGREHFYYACQTRRTTHTCDKENVRKDYIEVEVVRAVQHTILDDDTVEWIADSIMEASRRFKEQTQLSDYESRLREIKKQITNLVHAIEMGVAGDEVKERMDELQEEKRKYEGLIAVEKIAVQDYDRVTVIGYLESIRHGDPNDKEFQKMVIRGFIKAVYVYDDHLRIVVDFTGKDNTIDVPIKGAEKTADGSGDGFAQGLKRCTKTVLGEPLDRWNSIEFTGQRFVITWYLKTYQ
jgi:DNA invertase Pin-like site-specific DNA recombinase